LDNVDVLSFAEIKKDWSLEFFSLLEQKTTYRGFERTTFSKKRLVKWEGARLTGRPRHLSKVR
jgi:hypothetical protein